MLERSTLVATLLGVAACSGNLIVGHQSSGGSPVGSTGASSGGPSPSAGQSASTGTSGSSGDGTGNGSGVSGTGNGSGAGSGTGTGGATTGDVFGPIDGGYVFCELDPDLDAGRTSGTRWMCPPGTYICDFGHPGHCFQCLSDADCIDPAIPTYDHNYHSRSRCDLSSGISGYQNFCEVCLANADCKKGEVCDLNRAHREPPVIDNVGFETCGCLSDAGNACQAPICDPATCPLSEACTNDLECGNGKPYCIDGGCAPCRTNADCTHLKGYGFCSNNYCGDSIKTCTSDADCAGIVYASSCLTTASGQVCGCKSDDCIGNPIGPRCDQRVTDTTYGNCGCQTVSECASGQTCAQATVPNAISACQDTCDNDTKKCQAGYYCDPSNVCRTHCDPGSSCAVQEPVCDVNDVGQRNFNGVTWCYECLVSTDCDAGQACDSNLQCGQCNAAALCPDGQTCATDLACHATCNESDDCPAGQTCDTLDLLGAGPLCYQCLTAGDCPGDQGCDAKSHTCGRCETSGIYDCRPGDDCSNYWPDPEVKSYSTGVCLHRCDLGPCPSDMPSCQLVPSVSADHKYCVGCTQDSDCRDAGPGAWCDVTIHFTFQCQPADLRGPIKP